MTNKTLEYYNSHVVDFTSDTLEVNMNNVQERFLKYLSPGAHILDLGCGVGRDSLLFLQRGFHVTALDGSNELVKVASELIGQEVLCKTYEQMDWVEEFDAIWACASLLHVPSIELEEVLQKVVRALKPGGVFYVSFKYGDFEGYRKDRYYTDFTENTFDKLISAFKNISIMEQWISCDVRPGRNNEKWLNAILYYTNKNAME